LHDAVFELIVYHIHHRLRSDWLRHCIQQYQAKTAQITSRLKIFLALASAGSYLIASYALLGQWRT